MGPAYCQNQLRPMEMLLLTQLEAKAQLLDLCCGTGHLVQRLRQKGYAVTGLDGSESMLYYARQNAPDALFVLADARSFDLASFDVSYSFDAVYCMSASLNHMMSLDELASVFGNVHGVLKENGLFLFDLNHPTQMQKWWRGRVVEGEINPTDAWLLTPVYNAIHHTGYFQVVMFQAPAKAKGILQPCKNLIYRLLSLRLLTRLRLKVLSQFQRWQPHWQSSEVRYPVRGHAEAEVRSTLQAAGFTDIAVCTIDGHATVDDNHSAYFLCRKSSHFGGAT
ncbi:MAG: class I SAM-dependent methyltransferase [Cyanobacteria bacterium CRU_2_1]|nr:class I SAM-dependent methyltransferase [Cyanobacteria bacterium CRU_2_1]